MSFLLDDSAADEVVALLEAETEVLLSAATMAEALIVAGRRNVGAEMAALIDGLGLAVEPVTPADACQLALAHARWGRACTRPG